jgi:hypothetical protein
MSDDKRNEGQLVCDVIGLESYVLICCLLSPDCSILIKIADW